MSRHFNSAARWARVQTEGPTDAIGRERKTHCKHGHKFPENARWSVNWKGYRCRVCPECDRLRMQRKRENPDFRIRETAKAARWRQEYPEKYRAAWKAAEQAKRQFLLDARAGGCIQCGEQDPSCLDFHHRNGKQDKEGHIGRIRKFGWVRLRAEIAKCDVLCANCHRKHHRDERQAVN